MQLLRPDHFSVRYDLTFPVLSHLPTSLAYKGAEWQSRYFYHKRGQQREIIRSHMQRVFPGADSCVVEGWLHDYFRMVEQEALDTWFLNSTAIPDLVKMQGFEAIQELRESGRRVLLTGGHFGRFWMAGPAMRRAGFRVGTITRDGGEENEHHLHPAEYKYRLFKLKKLEKVLGGPFLVEGSDLRPLYRELDRSLITLIFDVPYAESQAGSVTVPFFNGSIKVPAGIFKIAKKTKAVVVPFYIRDLKGGKVVAEFSKPLEPNNYNDEEFMSLLARELEMRISAHPGYWWLWEALPLLWSSNNHESLSG